MRQAGKKYCAGLSVMVNQNLRIPFKKRPL
jgi:hypothetical protein